MHGLELHGPGGLDNSQSSPCHPSSQSQKACGVGNACTTQLPCTHVLPSQGSADTGSAAGCSAISQCSPLNPPTHEHCPVCVPNSPPTTTTSHDPPFSQLTVEHGPGDVSHTFPLNPPTHAHAALGTGKPSRLHDPPFMHGLGLHGPGGCTSHVMPVKPPMHWQLM